MAWLAPCDLGWVMRALYLFKAMKDQFSPAKTKEQTARYSPNRQGLQIAARRVGQLAHETNDDIRRSRFGYEESPGKAGG